MWIQLTKIIADIADMFIRIIRLSPAFIPLLIPEIAKPLDKSDVCALNGLSNENIFF